MSSKYDKYLDSDQCNALKKMGYEQTLQNIIEDNENYITQSMKEEFFEFLSTLSSSSNLVEYCKEFLYDKRFSLQGEVVNNRIYTIELGRACKKSAMRRSINMAIENRKDGIGTISIIADEAIANKLFFDIEKANGRNSTTIFNSFISDVGISYMGVQLLPMWTFEAFYDNDIFEGYTPKDLPCILGLPGENDTSVGYDSIERVVFALKVPSAIKVHKPTSFDAGMMPVWASGGKTKPHKECSKKYSDSGFSEYIHESINFNDIKSEIYNL